MKSKVGRRLKAISYFDGIATSGTCEDCGRLFRANSDLSPNIYQAIQKFLQEFENHDCAAQKSGSVVIDDSKS